MSVIHDIISTMYWGVLQEINEYDAMSVIIGTCQILFVFILGTSITNIPSDNATNWSYIKKAIKMVISNETICPPEQGYMFFSILEVYCLATNYRRLPIIATRK